MGHFASSSFSWGPLLTLAYCQSARCSSGSQSLIIMSTHTTVTSFVERKKHIEKKNKKKLDPGSLHLGMRTFKAPGPASTVDRTVSTRAQSAAHLATKSTPCCFANLANISAPTKSGSCDARQHLDFGFETFTHRPGDILLRA